MAPAASGQCRYCTPRPDNKSAASGALTMAANMIAQELGWRARMIAAPGVVTKQPRKIGTLPRISYLTPPQLCRPLSTRHTPRVPGRGPLAARPARSVAGRGQWPDAAAP
eukprot:scaffold20807_cov51-Phaeocystis_antarctica.AAC.4